MQTAFYIAGGALVVLAILISFIGMRNDDFPSPAALRIGVAFVAAVVVATAVFAVKTSQDEQQKRIDDQNEVSDVAEAAATEDNQATGVPSDGGSQAPGPRDETDGSTGNDASATGQGDPVLGKQVFMDQDCGGCHSLQDADASGQIGPNLDAELVDKDQAYIETSIVDPSADVVPGFSDGIMPQDFGDNLSDEELSGLVTYLYETTHQGKK